MADQLNIKDWKERIAAIASKSLGDSSVHSKLVDTTAGHDFPLTMGPFTFSVRPEASALIALVNSQNDLDDNPMEGVIQVRSDAIEYPPQISFSEKGAWLAYQVEAGVKGAGGADIGSLGLNIEGESVVQLCDYRYHSDRNEKIKDAIAVDLGSSRFAVRQDDLKLLGPNEATSYRVRAKLTTTVEASVSDALLANLNGLSSFLRSNTPVAIKFEAGASFKLVIGITDDFLVVFSRASEDRIRLAVRKGRISTQVMSGTTGVEIQLSDAAPINAAVDKLLEGIAGASVDKVDNLLTQTVISSLTSDQKNLFTQLLKRLKVDDDVTDLVSVRNQWETIKKEVRKRLEVLLKTKLSAAFLYEYSRIRSDSVLLQAVLPETAFISDGLHSSLIKTNLSDTLQWCRDHKVAPENYLHQSQLTTEQKWGLSLSLGNRFKIGDEDTEKLDRITREDWKGRRQLVFLGQRGYEGNWVGQKRVWMADFVAEMPNFEMTPFLSHFEFGLHFKWLWEETKLSNDELQTCIDHAEIWRTINDRAAANQELQQGLGKKVKIGFDIKIDDVAFRQLVKAAAETSNDHFALAMAKAMPWDSVDARGIVERRTRLYAPLWKSYLLDSERTYRDYARMARLTLQQLDNGVEVAWLEGEITSDGHTAWPVSFAEMIRLNGSDSNDLSGIADQWQRFRNSAKTLHAAIASDASPDQLTTVFKGFSSLWSQALQLRAAVVYWIDLASANSLLGHVERTMTVELVDERLQLNLAVPSR